MEKKSTDCHIPFYSWSCFLAMNLNLIIFIRNSLQTKVWAIYALPISLVVLAALTVAMTVSFIKTRRLKYVFLPAIAVVSIVINVGGALKCVKDITGGTQTAKTAYFRIYTDSVRFFADNEDMILGLDKKLAKEAKDHFAYDKTESAAFTVHGDKMELFSCTETAEITYYPNTLMVADITFSPKQGE